MLQSLSLSSESICIGLDCEELPTADIPVFFCGILFKSHGLILVVGLVGVHPLNRPNRPLN